MNGAGSSVSLGVLEWEAWAPGLTDKAAWRAWARGSGPRVDDGSSPPVEPMPPSLRRRAGRNDRLGLEVAWRLPRAGGMGPSVFGSRHGQVARSAVLLEALAQDVPLSPMDFSLSVHNATGGLFSIARQDRSATSSLAASGGELVAALLEAAGLLLEGAPEVLVSVHDEPPPALYAGHWHGAAATFGLGLRLGAGGQRLTMRLVESGPEPEGDAQGLELARILAQGQGRARWSRGGQAWIWELEA